MQKHRSSQAAWTEGEALERKGDRVAALRLFVKAALAEESDGEPLRARVLWERVAERTGPTVLLLERLATTSGQAKLAEDALAYWLAAEALATSSHDPDAARRAAEQADRWLDRRTGLAAERPPLAARVLDAHQTVVQAHLARRS